LNLPEKTKIRVENGVVILDYDLMRITLKIIFNGWVRSVDLRVRHLVDVSKEDLEHCGIISGIISFNAEFKFRSIFSRNADTYYAYSKRMLENLRCNYSWSEFIKNAKEQVFWKHMLNNK